MELELGLRIVLDLPLGLLLGHTDQPQQRKGARWK